MSTGPYEDTAFPDRIPVVVIVLLSIVIALLSVAALGAVALAVAQVLGVAPSVGTGFDLSPPEDGIGRVIWVQSALAIVTMFLVWLFSILVVAAYAQGSQRSAAANALILVRFSIAIIVIRTLVAAGVPFMISGSLVAALTVLATSAPLALAEIALLIVADCHFAAIRKNALT